MCDELSIRCRHCIGCCEAGQCSASKRWWGKLCSCLLYFQLVGSGVCLDAIFSELVVIGETTLLPTVRSPSCTCNTSLYLMCQQELQQKWCGLYLSCSRVLLVCNNHQTSAYTITCCAVLVHILDMRGSNNFITKMMRWVLLLFASIWLHCQAIEEPKAWFPLQFSGNLEITSHLIAEDSEYPPRTRRMTIFYDYINKRARADIEAGYEAAKFYIRRYDTKQEYMVRLPPIDDCKRSYLGESMPFPEIPSTTVYVNQVTLDGIVCEYFLFTEYDIRVHIYLSLDGAPVKLVQERLDDSTQLSVPLLTYDFTEVSLEEPDSSWFDLPAGYDHAACARHIGGWPYLHVFHYFVRF